MSEIVERILKVFEEKQLLAKRCEWGIEPVDGKYVLFPGCYVCGLAALLLDQPTPTDGETALNQELAAVEVLGLSPGYVEGFIAGFDGDGAPRDPENEYAEGFEDGRSTWNALTKRNRVYVPEEKIDKEMAEPDYDSP